MVALTVPVVRVVPGAMGIDRESAGPEEPLSKFETRTRCPANGAPRGQTMGVT